MYLAIHAVFILNENIRWLEEFIVYYIHLGVDHFYLYHNEGTQGFFGSKTTNRYGFPITTDSTEEDKNQLNRILSKYRQYITYVLWQPRDGDGKVIHGQKEAVHDCVTKFGHAVEWLALIDLDEFIFSETNVHLVEYLKSLDSSISQVQLIQKKFLDRFLSTQRFITQEFQCIDNLKIGTEWAPKNIIRCKDYLSIGNIHIVQMKHKTIVPDTNVFRFNHYNVNQKQLDWMKEFYNSETDFSINGIDDGMARYKDLFSSL